MNILMTAIGKRIQLIQHLKTQFRVIGADASAQNAAKNFVDAFYMIPRYDDPDYLPALLDICKRESIDLLIPLYELEFPKLCAAREQFVAIGTRLVLSDSSVVGICNDKLLTAAFFEKYDIPAPKTLTREEIEALKAGESVEDVHYPLIIKPLDGMGSAGVFRLHNQKELLFFSDYVKHPMIQSCAEGTEYTIDVLCDFAGSPVYIIPRIRLEVRSGEVVKSRTCRQQLVIDETTRLLAKLNEEGTVAGPMTVQCFLADDLQSLAFIEINPRFGGGVPLSFAAGADYAKALKAMAEGKDVPYSEEGIRAVTMMRYDQAVFEEG